MIIFFKCTEVFFEMGLLEQKCFRMSFDVFLKSEIVLIHKFMKCYKLNVKPKSIYGLLIYKYPKTYFTMDPFFVKEYTYFRKI